MRERRICVRVTRMDYRQPSASCVQSSLFAEPSTAPAIAAARLRRVSWSYAHLIEHADLGAEPIPELEFDQTLGWLSCAVEMAHAAERGLVYQALASCGEWCGLPNPDCRHCAISAWYAYQISANTEQKRSLT